jgi:hypothetical protein
VETQQVRGKGLPSHAVFTFMRVAAQSTVDTQYGFRVRFRLYTCVNITFYFNILIFIYSFSSEITSEKASVGFEHLQGP